QSEQTFAATVPREPRRVCRGLWRVFRGGEAYGASARSVRAQEGRNGVSGRGLDSETGRPGRSPAVYRAGARRDRSQTDGNAPAFPGRRRDRAQSLARLRRDNCIGGSFPVPTLADACIIEVVD